MTTRVDPSAIWILKRGDSIATAKFHVRGVRYEVQVYRDRALISSQMFDTGDEVSAWARTERDRMITEEGWQDTRSYTDSFQKSHVILYQSDAAFNACGVSVETFAAYVQALTEATVQACSTVATPQPLDIIVAVRPKGRVRVWLMVEPLSTDLRVDRLRASLEQVPPPPLTGGPLVFGLNGALANGRRRLHQTAEGFNPPIPDEWKGFADGATTIEDVVNRAWPDARPGLFTRWFRS